MNEVRSWFHVLLSALVHSRPVIERNYFLINTMIRIGSSAFSYDLPASLAVWYLRYVVVKRLSTGDYPDGVAFDGVKQHSHSASQARIFSRPRVRFHCGAYARKTADIG